MRNFDLVCVSVCHVVDSEDEEPDDDFAEDFVEDGADEDSAASEVADSDGGGSGRDKDDDVDETVSVVGSEVAVGDEPEERSDDEQSDHDSSSKSSTSSSSSSTSSSSSGSSSAAPAAPPAGSAPPPKKRALVADAVLEIGFATFKYYKADENIVCLCQRTGHGNRCRLQRSRVAGAKYAQGRPIGLMMAWLTAHLEDDDDNHHGHVHMDPMPSYEDREEGRREFMELPDTEFWLDLERPQRVDEGEGFEPDEAP